MNLPKPPRFGRRTQSRHYYTPEVKHGTLKMMVSKRNLQTSRVWFLGSMLNFRGVLIFFPVHWYVEYNMASWKITSFSRRHILKWFVFHCHASFLGCIYIYISWIYSPMQDAGSSPTGILHYITTYILSTFGFGNPYKHPFVAGRMDGGIDPRYIFGSRIC